MERFTVVDLFRRFPDDHACVAHLARERWGCDPVEGGMDCERCGGHRAFRYIETRKCYACTDCKAQVRPTAGTIFHGSRTPLTIWFYVFFQMAKTRTGIAAKQIERETGVTYKTAWRMCHLVRAALAEGAEEASMFAGVVEVDEVYMGSRKPRRKGQRKPGRGTIHGSVPKTPVIGVLERDEDGMPVRVRAKVTADTKRATVLPFIDANVEGGSRVYSDEYSVYTPLEGMGFRHDFVRHRAKQYAVEVVDGDTGEVRNVHTNGIEGFWSQVKGGVLNVHRGVSAKYLQRYVDEFAYRYSRRADDRPLCLTMLSRAASSGRHAARLAPTSPG
ncbi:IS1595 family transposase [Rubrivirga marina]|uniref:ISXO2-like transposase domain-containing protein n=1 Tax=Rubrivirga marina TaxID=1196024 RepID=A0A271J0F5_9BACT|nr:IS1595 family transposase [Rubrivirga marina]PAP76982.1 hypothetical protein BSZ37_11335 [Rubrivirga marina]